MVKQDDKKIASMLDSLENLPNGYKPNMEAKWELLENAIAPDRRNRKVIGYFKWAVAALVFLTIGGFIYNGWLTSGKRYTAEKMVIPNNPVNSPIIPSDSTSRKAVSNNPTIEREKGSQQLKYEPSIQKITEAKSSIQDTVLTLAEIDTSLRNELTMISEVKKEVKKQRYVSVDFGEDIPIAVSANPSQLKLKFLNKETTEEARQLKPGNTVMFRKSF